MGFSGGPCGKEPTWPSRRAKRHKFNLQVRKIHWRKAWKPTPVFLPEESHGQRSLAGNHPSDCKELDWSDFTHMILPLKPLPEHPRETKSLQHAAPLWPLSQLHPLILPSLPWGYLPGWASPQNPPHQCAQSPVGKTSEQLSEHFKQFFKEKLKKNWKYSIAEKGTKESQTRPVSWMFFCQISKKPVKKIIF